MTPREVEVFGDGWMLVTLHRGGVPVALSVSPEALARHRESVGEQSALWLHEGDVIALRWREGAPPERFRVGEHQRLPDGWWQINLTPVRA